MSHHNAVDLTANIYAMDRAELDRFLGFARRLDERAPMIARLQRAGRRWLLEIYAADVKPQRGRKAQPVAVFRGSWRRARALAGALGLALFVLLVAACGATERDREGHQPAATAGAAGAAPVDTDPRSPEQCNPAGRAGVYRVELTAIVGDCSATPDSFEASLQWPPGAPADCVATDYELSASGCSHRVRCREPNGSAHELSVTQLDAAGATVTGRYYSTPSDGAPGACWWDFNGTRVSQ